MIYFLQLGAPMLPAAFHNLPPGLSGWPAGAALDQASALATAQLNPYLPGAVDPVLFAPCLGYFSNARAYRQAHLGLLAGYAGIDELLFDAGGYGLLASTPDAVPLRPEQVQELREALAAFCRQYPDAKCEYAGPDWPALTPEPPFENQVLDLLAWLVFWADYTWWEPQAPLPVLANMDYTKHPHYQLLQQPT